MAATRGRKGDVERAARRARVAAHVLAGRDYTWIAAAEDVSRATVCGDVKAVKAEYLREAVSTRQEQTALECARLDALLAAVWTAAERGELASVEWALKIAERRARLMGLDQPERRLLAVADLDSMIEAELDAGRELARAGRQRKEADAGTDPQPERGPA